MRRFLIVLGALFVAAGLYLAVAFTPITVGQDFEGAVGLLVLAGAIAALWKVAGTPPNENDVAIPPWEHGGAIVHGEPERTPVDHPLSADEFSEIVAAAGEEARERGTVEDGLGVLRPPLRDALLDALVRGGTDREVAEARLATGEWTEDEWAAYVVEPSVGAPRWTLRQRFRAWLFPEATVRRLARQAVHGVARAADEAIPAVPGQRAPRTVPVLSPTLDDLQRGADGDLQRAIEPTAVARGPSPPSHDGLDEGFGDGERGDASGDGSSESTAEGEATDDGSHPSSDGGDGRVDTPDSTSAGFVDADEGAEDR